MSSIYVTLVIYFLALFGLGIWCTRRNQNVTDFLLAGRSLTVAPATLTLVATLFGGGCLTGTAQMGYDDGFLSIAFGILSGFVFLAVIPLLQKMSNFSNYATITQYLEDRFSSKMLRTVAGLLSMVALIGILGSQVSAVTGFLSALGFKNTVFAAMFAMVGILTPYYGVNIKCIT